MTSVRVRIEGQAVRRVLGTKQRSLGLPAGMDMVSTECQRKHSRGRSGIDSRVKVMLYTQEPCCLFRHGIDEDAGDESLHRMP